MRWGLSPFRHRVRCLVRGGSGRGDEMGRSLLLLCLFVVGAAVVLSDFNLLKNRSGVVSAVTIRRTTKHVEGA